MNNSWISVSDQLPEVGKMVLVCTINKESERDITIASFNGLSILHNSHGCNWSGADYYDVVTHWQPLPQLPNH